MVNSEHSLWYPTTFRNANVSVGPVEERKLNGKTPFALVLFSSRFFSCDSHTQGGSWVFSKWKKQPLN